MGDIGETKTRRKPIANPNLPPPPAGKYPAKAHCRRVAKWIAENGGPSSGVIYLEGQSTYMTEDDDQAMKFRQRRHFFYLTGCDLPDCYFAYDITEDKSILWIPPVDPESVMWAGLPLSPKEALERYDIDEALTSDELKSGKSLAKMIGKDKKTFLIMRDRADTAIFDALEHADVVDGTKHDFVREGIETCRVVKDEHEIAMIRHANIVSSYAHERILASVKSAKNERELNAVFVMHCHANGCKDQAYNCICASGTHASTLHYIHNDTDLRARLNLLIDAGCEYNCYCADITRTFPLNGSFTKESRETYELVLKMQTECMSMIRQGVLWEDVHMHAHKVAAQGLQNLGILKKGLSFNQLLESKVTCRFFPHGLGHYLGMDCHDSGGNANYEDPDEYFRYLRVRGRLPKGAVITDEPGIYFRKYPFEAELKEGKWDGIVDQAVLARYWEVGGVRIEDDILVKEDGYENLTTVKSSLDYIEDAVNAE